MGKIKILISYHKMAPLFKDSILTPIHVGRANAIKEIDHKSEAYKWLTDNMIGDNTGDNISDENDSYNEMTAIYWAWKNYDKLDNPDYIGFMHYRRHFVLNGMDTVVYNIQDFNDETYLDQIGYSEERMHQLVDGCDFVTHIGHVINVYNHFIENQRKEDIDLVNQIVLEQHPEYKELMDEYYAGNDSNFCNMFIFSKKIFFDYCEWIFPILEEYKKRINVNEKRFFVSERLTGLYMAGLMKNPELKFKTVPISFIDEPVEVTVAMKLDHGTMEDVAMSITSIMYNSKGYHSYHFYLLCNATLNELLKQEFIKLVEQFPKCSLDFIEMNISDEYLPLFLSELISSANKCLYISGAVISMFDIAEFYHVCSVDDYYLAGVPEKTYDPKEKDKKITEQLILINCKRMRENCIAQKATYYIQIDRSGLLALNEICAGQIGYIAWYYYTSDRFCSTSDSLFDAEKTRLIIQEEAHWRPFLIFDNGSPVDNNQNVYSVFWWENFRKLPLYFQKTEAHLTALETLYVRQQIEINQHTRLAPEPAEDWRSYGPWGKLKFYYKHNGFRKTVVFLGGKVFSRRKG